MAQYVRGWETRLVNRRDVSDSTCCVDVADAAINDEDALLTASPGAQNTLAGVPGLGSHSAMQTRPRLPEVTQKQVMRGCQDNHIEAERVGRPCEASPVVTIQRRRQIRVAYVYLFVKVHL